MSRGVFLAIALLATPASAETRYFSEISDVPMPAGFSESNSAVGFDSANARLVVADAAGPETMEQVRAFYAQSLPALGWSPSPTNDDSVVFVRGRERLTLDVRAADGRTQLHVQLVVRPPPPDGD
jgi:hypothetical protein